MFALLLLGSGFGILMVCAIVSVNFYFERYRGIASGIAMAGSGIGCLTIPLIFSRLCDYFGWRRALLVYSAFALLSAWLSVITFRPFVVAVFLNDATEKQNGPLNSTSGTTISDSSNKEAQTKMPLIVATVNVPEEERVRNIAPCEVRLFNEFFVTAGFRTDFFHDFFSLGLDLFLWCVYHPVLLF